jgi:hypothetical protein
VILTLLPCHRYIATCWQRLSKSTTFSSSCMVWMRVCSLRCKDAQPPIFTYYPVLLFFLPTFCFLWMVGEQSENLHPN